MDVTLLATTNSMTTAELRITIQDEGILERDEDFTIELDTTETRINIANSTSVVIVNDDGEYVIQITTLALVHIIMCTNKNVQIIIAVL